MKERELSRTEQRKTIRAQVRVGEGIQNDYGNNGTVDRSWRGRHACGSIVCGVFPARKAARVDPMVALRYD